MFSVHSSQLYVSTEKMATLLGVLLKHFILNPQGVGNFFIFIKKTKVNIFVGNLTSKTLMIYVFNKIFYLPVAVGLAKNKLFENIFFINFSRE